jgi:hypothetical protein
MKLSDELQLGKAGEHLVCADLILQGFNAFPSDQGVPFDIVVENNNQLKKIQVKSTSKMCTVKIDNKNSSQYDLQLYRFNTRRGKGAVGRTLINEIDFHAFVALDTKTIWKILKFLISITEKYNDQRKTKNKDR